MNPQNFLIKRPSKRAALALDIEGGGGRILGDLTRLVTRVYIIYIDRTFV